MKFFKILGCIIKYAFLILIFAFVLFPFLYLICGSMKTNSELMVHPEWVFPRDVDLSNYIKVFKSENFHFGRMLFNSVWFTGLSVAIVVIISCVSGYVFSRGEFKGKKIIFIVFSSLMFISFGSITMYPSLQILSKLNLSSSLWGLLFMQCFGIPIMNMYIVKGFIDALPKELDQSAEVDGCTFTGIFFRIILPLLKPVAATLIVLGFNGAWNSYLMPAIFTMNRPEQQTLMVGLMSLKNSGQGATEWNIMLAGTLIAMSPTIIIYAFANKMIVNGIAEGAVKG